jgi:hypothetical protein
VLRGAAVGKVGSLACVASALLVLLSLDGSRAYAKAPPELRQAVRAANRFGWTIEERGEMLSVHDEPHKVVVRVTRVADLCAGVEWPASWTELDLSSILPNWKGQIRKSPAQDEGVVEFFTCLEKAIGAVQLQIKVESDQVAERERVLRHVNRFMRELDAGLLAKVEEPKPPGDAPEGLRQRGNPPEELRPGGNPPAETRSRRDVPSSNEPAPPLSAGSSSDDTKGDSTRPAEKEATDDKTSAVPEEIAPPHSDEELEHDDDPLLAGAFDARYARVKPLSNVTQGGYGVFALDGEFYVLGSGIGFEGRATYGEELKDSNDKADAGSIWNASGALAVGNKNKDSVAVAILTGTGGNGVNNGSGHAERLRIGASIYAFVGARFDLGRWPGFVLSGRFAYSSRYKGPDETAVTASLGTPGSKNGQFILGFDYARFSGITDVYSGWVGLRVYP